MRAGLGGYRYHDASGAAALRLMQCSSRDRPHLPSSRRPAPFPRIFERASQRVGHAAPACWACVPAWCRRARGLRSPSPVAHLLVRGLRNPRTKSRFASGGLKHIRTTPRLPTHPHPHHSPSIVSQWATLLTQHTRQASHAPVRIHSKFKHDRRRWNCSCMQ